MRCEKCGVELDSDNRTMIRAYMSQPEEIQEEFIKITRMVPTMTIELCPDCLEKAQTVLADALELPNWDFS